MLEWQIQAEGRIIKRGVVSSLNIQPQETQSVSLGYRLEESRKETFLNIFYRLKEATPSLEAGYTVARQQLEINPYNWKTAVTTRTDGLPEIYETRYTLEINALLVTIRFDKKNGLISGYAFKGKEFMAEGTYLQPNFWRAPTDNDFSAGLPSKLGKWRRPVMNLTSFESERKDKTVEVRAGYQLPECQSELTLVYRINTAGEIHLTQSLSIKETGNGFLLPRFGMQLTLCPGFDDIEFYGRGPAENYADRKTSAFIGRYRQKVGEQYYPYIRPQETGNKSDLRWFDVMHRSNCGISLLSASPFNAAALHFSTHDLDDSSVKTQRHGSEVTPRPVTVLSVDLIQMGLGCIDTWGSLPMEKYLLKENFYQFDFIIRPVRN